MKRTVVHLVYSLGCGGLEQVIVNLINNSGGYDVQHVIITLSDIQDLHSSIKVETPIYSLDKKPGKDLGAHFRLYKLLKKIKPHVLHTYNFATIEYHPIATLAGVNIRVHCDHGRGGDDPKGQNAKNNFVRRMVSKFLHHYFVVSPDLYNWAKDVLKVKSQKVRLVYNGVDLEEYKPKKDKGDRFTLCTVGRADPVKNQALLINAYSQAIDQCPDLKDHSQLLIAGDGPIFGDLKAQLEQTKNKENIELLGYRSDVSDILRNAHLFILSSVYEAMPMTVLEAMACKIPVICTNVGGVPHLVSDKEGWLVPTKDVDAMAKAIINAFKNSEESNAKAINGRNLVEEKYSIAAMVKSYMDAYECESVS